MVYNVMIPTGQEQTLLVFIMMVSSQSNMILLPNVEFLVKSDTSHNVPKSSDHDAVTSSAADVAESAVVHRINLVKIFKKGCDKAVIMTCC